MKWTTRRRGLMLLAAMSLLAALGSGLLMADPPDISVEDPQLTGYGVRSHTGGQGCDELPGACGGGGWSV